MAGASISRWLVTLVFLALAVLGIAGASNNLPQATTAVQRAQSLTQLGFAASGLVALLFVWRRRPHLRTALFVWTALIGISGGLAPVAWGDAPWSSGVFAFVTTLLFAGVIDRLSLRAVRG
jgi:hypothetical protein